MDISIVKGSKLALTSPLIVPYLLKHREGILRKSRNGKYRLLQHTDQHFIRG